ncbi:MAG: hypothetical protein R3234_07600, partial [Thermoanaerobaculia bacterium]|nr:hypothetical protein [Thermoanaerobaculia bacterium]
MVDVSSKRGGGTSPPERRRWILLLVAAMIAGALGWWTGGRWTAEARALRVLRLPEAPVEARERNGVSQGSIRILAWNIAHGRGSGDRGWARNWMGGDREERSRRLDRIGRVLREVAADLVVLNEVDFDAVWSGGIDQAEVLARLAGYPVRVEQRNFDLSLPGLDFAFGNAILSRVPVLEARRLELPVHSRLEEVIAGTKSSALVVVET